MMRWRRRKPPTEPIGVRLTHRDGSVTPVELVYRGKDIDGLHIWEVTAAAHQGDVLSVDALPAQTIIVVRGEPR